VAASRTARNTQMNGVRRENRLDNCRHPRQSGEGGLPMRKSGLDVLLLSGLLSCSMPFMERAAISPGLSGGMGGQACGGYARNLWGDPSVWVLDLTGTVDLKWGYSDRFAQSLTAFGGQEFALPFVNVTGLAPITANFDWHRETPDKPRQMMDFEASLVNLVQKYRSTFDAEGRRSLMYQYNNIFTQNVYSLGVFTGRYGLGVAKRVKNIADGAPVFMYTWVEEAILLDTLWTPVDQQLPQNRPDTIPVYKK
jgi:hypothetical protein